MQRKKSGRETYTTSINNELVEEFRLYCAIYGLQQNEVLEELIFKLLDEKGQKVKELIKERGIKDEKHTLNSRRGNSMSNE